MNNNYIITEYSFNRAKELGLKIKLSQFSTKKLDVYDAQNNYINSIGNINYNDYGSYLKIFGQIYANKRQKLYHARHQKGINIINSKQYLSANILW